MEADRALLLQDTQREPRVAVAQLARNGEADYARAYDREIALTGGI